MPPPLVTQDGREAFEHAAFGVMIHTSTITVSEQDLIQQMFYALIVRMYIARSLCCLWGGSSSCMCFFCCAY